VVACPTYAKERKELIASLLQLFSTDDVKDQFFRIIRSADYSDRVLKLILTDEIERSKEIQVKFDTIVTCFFI